MRSGGVQNAAEKGRMNERNLEGAKELWKRKRGKTPGERGFSVGLLVRRIEISGRGIPESAIV